MLYRRNPFKFRRPVYPSENYSMKYDIEDDIKGPKELESIPLPTEDIGHSDETINTDKKRNFSFLNMINHIPIEEVILIGLIFLLLDETLEDDFLLIILVYILLTGIDKKLP
jgi:hypothetical protein